MSHSLEVSTNTSRYTIYYSETILKWPWCHSDVGRETTGYKHSKKPIVYMQKANDFTWMLPCGKPPLISYNSHILVYTRILQ